MIHIKLNENVDFQLEAWEQKAVDDYVTECMRVFGNWEPNVTAKYLAILDHARLNNIEGLIVDVGACFGYYSIIAALNGFNVIAYEPNPYVINVLEKNVFNLSENRIEIRNYGLGDIEEIKSIQYLENNIGGSYLIDKNYKDPLIQVRRLDDEIIDKNIVVLKIDTEGNEPGIINGGSKTIADKNIDFIFIEISPKFTSIESIIDDIFRPLWEANYLSFDIGLQDSGYLDDAIQVFKLFFSSENLKIHLTNVGQTNFLFIKSEINKLGVSVSDWKEKLIIKWTREYVSFLEKQNLDNTILFNNALILEDTIKAENRKLFNLLKSASDYQRDLEMIIQDRDEEIKTLITEKGLMQQEIDSLKGKNESI